MGPKPKKAKKAKKAKEKRPKTPKKDYETRIAERNAVLAAARRRVQEAEDAYLATEKKYQQTQEDLTDIIKYLQHEIEENNLEIESFDEKIGKFKEEISNNDKHYLGIISKMKALYHEREKVLNYKIRQHLPKLSAFEEVRQQREEFLRKKEELWNKMQEVNARHEKEIYEAEQQVIIKQDTMQKEMEFKLTTLARDFNQATDIAIGETTNKLIKENINLGNMLTCTQEIFERARASYQKVQALEKRFMYSYELLDEEHHMIFTKYTNQVNNIENLVRTQEELRERISLSGKLIKENRRLQRDIAEKECTLYARDEEYEKLLQRLTECEEKFNSLKDKITLLRRNLINLEHYLHEATRRVKHGIDIENAKELPEELGENVPVESEFEDWEEALKEYKYKVRQSIIASAMEALTNAVINDLDLQQERPSDYRLTLQSIASNIPSMRSYMSSRRQYY